VLSNSDNGGSVMEAVKWRIAEDALGLPHVDWNARNWEEEEKSIQKNRNVTSPPSPPIAPSSPFHLMEGKFNHPAHGDIEPCFVQPKLSNSNLSQICETLLETPVVKTILSLSGSDPPPPTFISSYKRFLATHIRLEHFSGNTFNASLIWTNAEVREAEGYGSRGDGADVVVGLDERVEVEWVDGEEQGWAFKGNFWGKEGELAKTPSGTGKESAEVWFGRV